MGLSTCRSQIRQLLESLCAPLNTRHLSAILHHLAVLHISQRQQRMAAVDAETVSVGWRGSMTLLVICWFFRHRNQRNSCLACERHSPLSGRVLCLFQLKTGNPSCCFAMWKLTLVAVMCGMVLRLQEWPSLTQKMRKRVFIICRAECKSFAARTFCA